jgi:hypothetical protein
MMSGELMKAETTLLKLLVLLIETYEQKHYPMGEPTLAATLPKRPTVDEVEQRKGAQQEASKPELLKSVKYELLIGKR